MRPRIANPRSDTSQESEVLPLPPMARAARLRGTRHAEPAVCGMARGQERDSARVGRSAPRQDPIPIGLRPAADPVACPGVSGRIRRLYDFELEPEVRDWL